MDVQNAAVALVLSIFTQFEFPAQFEAAGSKFFSELFCCEAVEMAQIGLLHHFGRRDADLLAIGAIFFEHLINQCLLLCHRLNIHCCTHHVDAQLKPCKKKPPPKAGVLKDQRSVSLFPPRELFSSHR